MAPVLAVLPALAGVAGTAGTAAAGAGGLASTLGLIGSGIGAAGTIYSGFKANQNAQFEADQLKAQGHAQYAIAERKAIADREQGNLVSSRARSILGASGSGGVEPGSSNLAVLTGLQKRTQYNADTDIATGLGDLYTAEARAAATRDSGHSALAGSIASGIGTTIYGFNKWLQGGREYDYLMT